MKTRFLTLCFLQVVRVIHAATDPWISASDEETIRQEGGWTESRFRYAIAESMATQKDGAALEFEFSGTAIAVRLGANNLPANGEPNRGTLVATVDDGNPSRFTHMSHLPNHPAQSMRRVPISIDE